MILQGFSQFWQLLAVAGSSWRLLGSLGFLKKYVRFDAPRCSHIVFCVVFLNSDLQNHCFFMPHGAAVSCFTSDSEVGNSRALVFTCFLMPQLWFLAENHQNSEVGASFLTNDSGNAPSEWTWRAGLGYTGLWAYCPKNCSGKALFENVRPGLVR